MSGAASGRTAGLNLLDPKARAPGSTRRAALFGALLVAGAAIVVFAPTLAHRFVWDDHEQIVTNRALQDWGSLPRFWTQDVLAVTRPEGLIHSNYYRPLFFTQYLLYFKLFGLNAAAWHAAAILMHIVAAWAALFLLLRLGFRMESASLGALLFALHPAHGESVSWLAAAFNDPPVSALLMVALAAHAAAVRAGRHGSPWQAVAAYGAALAIKESALAFLLLVPVVHWFVRGTGADAAAGGKAEGASPGFRSLRAVYSAVAARRRWHLPYLAVTVVYFAARRLALGSFFGVYDGAKSLAELAPTFPWLAVWYLRFLVWPFGLAPSYPIRALESWSDPRAWGSLLALLVLVGALWRITRASRVARFALLWTLASVWPVLNIRSFRAPYLIHQRYLYLAVLGLCLLVAWWLMEQVFSRRIRFAVAGLLLIAWPMSHLSQNGAWATDRALWTRIAQVDPANPASFDYLGAEALRDGRIGEADSLFRRAMAADSTSPMAYYNLGVIAQTRRGDPAGALEWYEKSIARFARRPDSNRNDEAVCRLNAAACLAQLGRREEALAQFVALADGAPYRVDAAMNAALLYYEVGDLAAAKAILARAHERNPDDLSLAERLVEVCLIRGDAAEAVAYAEGVVRRLPNSAGAAALLKRAVEGWDARQQYKGGVVTNPR